MAGGVEGKAVSITGAARGQGRSHAIRVAAERRHRRGRHLRAGRLGAVPDGDAEDLAQTVQEVSALGRRRAESSAPSTDKPR
jgi:(+)-trans-carveol dehydrogenase